MRNKLYKRALGVLLASALLMQGAGTDYDSILADAEAGAAETPQYITGLTVNDSTNKRDWTARTDLQAGNYLYGDRDVYFLSVPEQLIGAEWIQTACDSKAYENDLATFKAGKAVSVFIVFDTRTVNIPSWMSDWKQTEGAVRNSSNVCYRLYQKDFSEGSVITLGTNGQPNGTTGYMVIVAKQGTVTSAATNGDINIDGLVNMDDVLLQRDYLSMQTAELSSSAAADYNDDGVINAADLTCIKRHVMKPIEVTPISDPAEEVDTSGLYGWATVEGDGLETTTGGAGGETVTVTTRSEFAAVSSDDTPRIIMVDGVIDCDGSAIRIGSNKTVIGVDDNAEIKGGLDINTESNIIISNLTIDGEYPNGGVADCLAARNVHHLWVDHVTLHDAGDGLLDLTIGSNYITVSWCRFYYDDTSNGHRLASLTSNGTTAGDTDTGRNKVTYHHNWFDRGCDQRMPRILFGQGHVYNNYYSCEGNSYCIGVGSYASVLVEGNYFKNVRDPHEFMYTHALPAYITARDNVYDNITGNKQSGLGGGEFGNVEPFTDPPYEYALDDAEDIPSIVMNSAGPQ